METMHAAGRRNLPPVPRPSTERTGSTPEAGATATLTAERPVAATSGPDDAELVETSRFEPYVDDAATGRLEPVPAGSAGVATSAEAEVAPTAASHARSDDDPAQRFVARLRAAAGDFAEAAGAESAVVREAVPPARHRRSRCRVALRYADGVEVDLTLLGPVERAARASRPAFDTEITAWLGSGLPRDAAWLVSDPDSPDGIAVDLTAWAAAT